MTHDNSPTVPASELCDLVVLAGEGQLTDEQTARLERLVTSDDEACLHYALLMHVQAGLWRRIQSDTGSITEESRSLLENGKKAGNGERGTTMDEPFPGEGWNESSIQHSPSPLPPVIIPTLPSPLSPSPTFIGSPLFSYLIAGVIFGIGLAIGALVHVSQPAKVVKPSAPLSSPLSPRPSVVARITGMVDCVWEDSGLRVQGSGTTYHAAPAGTDRRLVGGHHEVVGAGGEGGGKSDSPLSTLHSPLIALGDRLALRSGLLELTYNTGAKVILQGPVTYEVESAVGGYLSVGKLTAKLEKKSEVRGRKSESANQKSEIINQNFIVRTPTAIVTDLGTEFGVEVSKEGNTVSHVFQGVVEVRQADERGTPSKPLRLRQGEAAEVVHHTDGVPSVQRIMTDHTVFVRSEELAKVAGVQHAESARFPEHRWPLLDKTFVAWVSLDNLGQSGVGVVSIASMPDWDGIVFAEVSPRKWMIGSHMWARSEKDQSAYSNETADRNTLLQIAAVYRGTTITLYRNGVEYAKYDTGMVQSYSRDAIVLIGKRHPQDGSSQPPTLVGSVDEVRIYSMALPPSTIASLKPNERSPIKPMGCWTFEDGTARDVAGTFPMGELRGNAWIDHGKLILDGKDSYLLVPSPGVDQNK